MTIPILVWNFILTDKLPKAFQPEIFWSDIPPFLAYGENISRTLVFIIMLIMPLRIITPTQKKGLSIYIVGTLLYFSSWLILIFFPNNIWSKNLFGFLAPAYTPLVWLIGIGLIGNSFYSPLPYRRWIFILTSIIFLIFHNIHAYILYCRIH